MLKVAVAVESLQEQVGLCRSNGVTFLDLTFVFSLVRYLHLNLVQCPQQVWDKTRVAQHFWPYQNH